MTPESFLKEFSTIANAPGGVQRLREMILQLAVMGKLVAQNPEDEPASELLKRIEAEKKELLSNGVIKKEKSLPKIKEVEKPYLIPNNWAWCRLGACTNIIMGQSPDSKSYNEMKNGLPFFQGKTEFGKLYPIPKKWCSSPKKIAPDDSILISVRAPVGPTNICNMVACIGRGLSAIQTLSDSSNFYFLYFFRANEKRIESLGTGSTFKAISLKILDYILVPLPPVAEQKRIVAKVDQLMALCDRLEAQQQKRATLVKQARISALNELANAQGKEALQTSWKRVQTHLSMLFDHPDDVEDLKKCILQNAVMGKLVPQNPDDEPASELLKKIAEEKADLIKKGQIKRQKPLPKIRETEKPFDIPHGWEWCRLNHLGFVLGGGTPSKSNKTFWSGSIPWISPKDMKVDYILDAVDHISDEALEKSSVKLVPENSVLVVLRGMILAHSFPVAITKTALTINQDMKALRPYLSEIVDYISILIRGNKTKYLQLVERSSHGTCRLETDKFFSSIIALPPISEQARIVEKTHSLLTLCDHLQNQLDEFRTIAEQLTQSIVETITGQSISNTLKAPHLRSD